MLENREGACHCGRVRFRRLSRRLLDLRASTRLHGLAVISSLMLRNLLHSASQIRPGQA